MRLLLQRAVIVALSVVVVSVPPTTEGNPGPLAKGDRLPITKVGNYGSTIIRTEGNVTYAELQKAD